MYGEDEERDERDCEASSELTTRRFARLTRQFWTEMLSDAAIERSVPVEGSAFQQPSGQASARVRAEGSHCNVASSKVAQHTETRSGRSAQVAL